MATVGHVEHAFWRRLDSASFGIIYGSITALALLMAFGAHPDPPVSSAVVLFGSVLAISLAKAFAEVMSNAIEQNRRITRQALSRSWDHAKPTLIAANLPALLFLASAFGLWSAELAMSLSLLYCIALLMSVGGRVGWRLDRSWVSAGLGALFAGGVGAALALVKYLIH